jgi:hypothetical protein
MPAIPQGGPKHDRVVAVCTIDSMTTGLRQADSLYRLRPGSRAKAPQRSMSPIFFVT